LPAAAELASLFVMGNIVNPHDAFFCESFGRREIAQDFLYRTT